MQVLKKIIITGAVCLTAFSTQAQIQMLDRVIAVVNNIAITQSQLDNRIKDVEKRSAAGGLNLPDRDILKKQILDQLVVESLQLDLANRFEVVIPDEEVNAAVENIIKSNNLTQEQFFEQLKRDQIGYSELRESLRRQLTMQTVTEGVVSRRIRISDREVENFLQSADAQVWALPDYRIGHILVALPSSPSSDVVQAAQDKAQDIYNRLEAGANFADTAIAESNGQMALNGGNLGWRKPSELPTLFADALKEMSVDQVSTPLRSQAGFHIIKVYEVRGQQKRVVKQNRSRHILLKTSEILDDKQAAEKLSQIRQRILNGEDFGELATEYSEDIGTRLSGGDLGWASPGLFVPAFERTIEQSAINEISEPFKSQFGWHILQVLERRDEDMTQQALRNRARNIIMGRRFEDETQIWIQELRDDAYIDIKI